MHPNESLLRTFLAALASCDAAPALPELADHITLHIPGRNRFGGDYFGKVAVMGWVQAQQRLWASLTVDEVRSEHAQMVARIAVQTTAQGTPFLCHGVFIFQIEQAQILEWWCQPDDQSAFDAYWAYHPAAIAQGH